MKIFKVITPLRRVTIASALADLRKVASKQKEDSDSGRQIPDERIKRKILNALLTTRIIRLTFLQVTIRDRGSLALFLQFFLSSIRHTRL